MERWEFSFNIDESQSPQIPFIDVDAGELGTLAPAPIGWDFRVAWISSPCHTAPEVVAEGDEQLRAVTVTIGPEIHSNDADDAACASVAVVNVVDMKLSHPVSEQEVDLRVTE